MTGPSGRTLVPWPRVACGRLPTSPTRPRGDRATKRPANRQEAGGAPAIGIEARKGETRLRRGSVRSTRARPEGVAHLMEEKRPQIIMRGVVVVLKAAD